MASISKRRGSTLLEVLIAVAVITILSGVTLLYGSGGRDQVNVYVETIELSQVILRMKSQAISIYYNPVSLTCGYGVKVDVAQETYTTFRYTGTTPADCANIVTLRGSNIQEIEHFTLEGKVNFVDDGTVDEILFVPPDPTTYLWNNNVKVVGNGTIHVSNGKHNTDRTVTISTGGQISY